MHHRLTYLARTCKAVTRQPSTIRLPWARRRVGTTRIARCTSATGGEAASFNLEFNNFSYDFGFDFDSVYMLRRRKEPTSVLELSTSSSLQALQAFCEYQQALAQSDDDINLLHCAVLQAKMAYPDASEEECRRTIAEIAAAVTDKLQGEEDPRKKLHCINRVLYGVYKVDGAVENLYQPDSNFINAVLLNKQGTPAILTLIYIEVAALLHMPCRPLILPSHCFVRPLLPDCGFVVDAYNNGQICSLETVAKRLSLNMGFTQPLIQLDPSWEANPPTHSNRDLLYRMLSNLRECYWGPVIRGTLMVDDVEAAQKQVEASLAVSRYLRATEPKMGSLLRDQGYILAALERVDEAQTALRGYLEEAGEVEDKSEVEQLLQHLDKSQGKPPV